MLFITWKVGGFLVSIQIGRGKLLLIIVSSCCWMSISMSTLAFVIVSCLLLAGACLFSHCLRSWHQGFQINFLKRLIMALTSFAAACLVSFKTSCLVVQAVGTRPRMR